MGAVLGIAAFGRTQEKIAGASTTSTGVAAPIASTPASAPAQVVNNTIVPATSTPLQRVETAPVVIGYAGKPSPPVAEQPLI